MALRPVNIDAQGFKSQAVMPPERPVNFVPARALEVRIDPARGTGIIEFLLERMSAGGVQHH